MSLNISNVLHRGLGGLYVTVDYTSFMWHTPRDRSRSRRPSYVVGTKSSGRISESLLGTIPSLKGDAMALLKPVEQAPKNPDRSELGRALSRAFDNLRMSWLRFSWMRDKDFCFWSQSPSRKSTRRWCVSFSCSSSLARICFFSNSRRFSCSRAISSSLSASFPRALPSIFPDNLCSSSWLAWDCLSRNSSSLACSSLLPWGARCGNSLSPPCNPPWLSGREQVVLSVCWGIRPLDNFLGSAVLESNEEVGGPTVAAVSPAESSLAGVTLPSNASGSRKNLHLLVPFTLLALCPTLLAFRVSWLAPETV
eukprot:scaffold3804_cov381-Prasinococcus_capsulatus_cf.AAC.7